jgi:phosphoglycerate kinase
MKTPRTIKDIDVAGKNVIVRADLEWPSEGCPRQKATESIVKYLESQMPNKIKIIGHKNKNYPNLRDDPREEANDPSLAAELADGFNVYINEAFATSHRKHCSIDALPRFMKSQGKEVVIGPRFEKELEALDNIFIDGYKVLVIGGTKVKDKNRYANQLATKFSAVLKGGLLEGSPLREDGLDIAVESVNRYANEIKKAKLIVAAGVMGKYEDSNSEYGTKEVLNAIAESKAYKIAGGGDIEAAISKYGLDSCFDWISVGGGAMLEYLATGTLPGILALTL